MINVVNYQKAYRETIAVDGLSFEVESGTVLGLVGPNGAGKTTTLRALAGIITPTGGKLMVGGFDIVEQPLEAKRQVAFIPDEPRLFESLTVWEHLQFTAAAYRVPNFESVAETLIDQFELRDKKDALAQELSRGMRQKVAICCAYLYEPKAILFDEPHTGLDPHGIRTMKATVQERAKKGAAVIVSSHLLGLIEDLCTHLLILRQGESLFHGTMTQAREMYPELGHGTTLEEIFFHATTREKNQSVTLEPSGRAPETNGQNEQDFNTARTQPDGSNDSPKIVNED